MHNKYDLYNAIIDSLTTWGNSYNVLRCIYKKDNDFTIKLLSSSDDEEELIKLEGGPFIFRSIWGKDFEIQNRKNEVIDVKLVSKD